MWVLDVYVDVQFTCTCSGFDKHKMDSTSMCNPPHLSLLDSTMDLSLAELKIIGGLFVLSLQCVYFSEGRGVKVRLRRHLSPLANVYKSLLQGQNTTHS